MRSRALITGTLLGLLLATPACRKDPVIEAIKMLNAKDADGWDRTRLIKRLSEYADPRAAGPVAAFLDDEEAEARESAAWTLVKLGAGSIPHLRKMLASKRPDARRLAAMSLGLLKAKEASKDLRGLFVDSNESVRKAAVRALGLIGDASVADAMGDKSFAVRLEVVKALARIKDPSTVGALAVMASTETTAEQTILGFGADAVKPLLGLLKDRSASQREVAAEMLGKIGHGDAAVSVKVARPLASLVKDSNSGVRQKAIEALVTLKGVDVSGSLIPALGHKDPGVRGAAARALGKLGYRNSLQHLLVVLNDKDVDVRLATASALGYLKGVGAVEALSKLITEKDSRLRAMAAHSLGQIRNPRAVSSLRRLVRDKEMQVRKAAVMALGAIGGAASVPPLLVAIRDKDMSVRGSAVWALGRTGDRRAVAPLLPLIALNWRIPCEVKMEAIKALRALRHPRAIGRLIRALGLNSCKGAVEAIEATLVEFGPVAVKPLIAGMSAWEIIMPYWSVRWKSVALLGRIGDSRAVPALLGALKRRDEVMRRKAALALGQLGDPRALKPLVAAMRDRDRHVRPAAALALGKLKDPRALAALIKAYHTSDEKKDHALQRGVVKALCARADPLSIKELVMLFKKENDCAMKALGRIGEPAVPALIVLLNDNKMSTYTKEDVVKALSKTRDARAVQALKKIYQDKKSALRQAANDALAATAASKVQHTTYKGKDPHAFSTADQMYKQGRRANPVNRARLLPRLMVYIKNGARIEDPGVVALLERAEGIVRQEKVQQLIRRWAESYSRKLLSLSAKANVGKLNKAGEAYKRGDLQVAVKLYCEVLEDAPRHLAARNNLALALIHQGSLMRAQLELEVLRRLDLRYLPAAVNLSVVYELLDRGDSNRAATLASDANAATRGSVQATFNAAWFKAVQGKNAEVGRLLAPMVAKGLGGKVDRLDLLAKRGRKAGASR